MQPSEEIKNKLDIVDLIKDYIPLQAAGMNFRARCPFHNEKTPSFMVSPDKQIWHCFGCGKGGDIFKFIMEIEGIEFVEALRLLATKAGVVLRRQNPQEVSAKMRWFDIMDIARRFYHEFLLKNPQAQVAREYLRKRGLDEATIEEWQIGYSPDSWNGLLNILKRQGYQEAEIVKTGMIIKNPQKHSYYDRFRARIMFPINDVNSRVVAFSARVSPEKETTEQMGKYINSPQTSIYNKSQVLFALDKAKQAIRQQDQAIIVEGQMDAITAHQFGYHNVVASSGTALTKEQIRILKRFTKNFALAFDADEAGYMASERGIREALEQDINVKVILVPGAKDPDECIRQDKMLWEQAVKEAEHTMTYFFRRTFGQINTTEITGRRQVAAKLLPIIASIENKIEKSYWLKALAEKLNVDEAVLYEALPKKKLGYQKNNQSTDLSASNQLVKKKREEVLSEFFLALLFKFFDLLEYVIQAIDTNHLQGEVNQAIYKNLIFYYNKNSYKSTDSVLAKQLNFDNFNDWLRQGKRNNSHNGHSATDQSAQLNKLILLGDKEYFEFDYNEAKAEIIRIIIFLKKAFLNKAKKEIEQQIILAEEQKNEQRSLELMEELKKLSDEFRDLNK